ncbi:hypothetical protein [Haemophilus influenzae]|uniref:Transposase n=1 Tax=Haemophilus influenzae TaxID=727 RepID=A0ABD6WV04_HAEIF|nr:hypothetical protein [Haemophilus influenzae]EDK06861.1 hypothetical protein CGSHiAA_00250 [Haemophilus influenzae PittAA]KPH68585.1 integrase [Haemophilus influenzae]MCK8793597.1 transposase [Haemophilus influenzae]MCK8823105.1 transposase [Haemophilus influenzae]MCK8848393.1 transposase [Haemophilus influenzae]
MAILPSVLAQYAERVEKAGFGEKEKIIEEGCAFTGLSRATFLRQIKPYRPASGRKVRSDKGKHQMDANELKLISAAWLHLRRKNGKTMATLERILDILRANDKVKAEFVDEKTGEVRPYSASSVERALRNANLHPDQLLRPAPVVQLQSRHPNHVWQIDPSLCVLYYLKETGKGNDIVERQFESGLRFMNVSGLAELNQLAHQWMRYFNAKAVHSRHGMTRYSAWQKIHAKDLIYPPSREICQELMITALTERLVTDKLEISFENHRYDVRDVPDVKIGEKITVGKNPYRPECVQVHCFEQVFADDGSMSLKPYWVVLEPVKINELGFRVDAAIIGEEYKAHRKTAFETNKEQAEQLAYGVETEDELKRAKKANKPLFNGEINPYQHIENTDLNWYMPKKGQEHELTTNARRVEQKPMSVVEFAKNGKARWGELWNGECYQWVNGRYPQGVPPLEAERLLSLGFEDFKAEFVAPEPKTSHLKLLAA